jgi:ribosomal protein S6
MIAEEAAITEPALGTAPVGYPIKRFRRHLYREPAQMTPERAIDVDSGLKLTEEVLRHLLIRRD